MMNYDERFQQRWEFRRREVDGDTSSDDNGSNSRGDPYRNPTLVTDLVFLENDEASDDPRCPRHDEKLDDGQLETVKADEKKVTSSKRKKVQKKSEGQTVKKKARKRQVTKNDEANDDPRCHRHDEKLDNYNGEQLEAVKTDEKKVKSSKKKKVVQKKSEGRTIKKTTRKRRVSKNEIVMFKDLKIFADSLIHELAVAQGNMFAHMREEMRKLVDLEPIKKNLRRSRKKKMCLNDSTKTGAKPQKNNRVLELTNEPQKSDRLRLSAMAQANLGYGSDHQVVFSSLDPLPKPQFQNQRNSIHLDDHIPSGVPMISSPGSKTEFDGLMAAKTFSYRISEFQPEERSGNRSLISVGLLGQNSSQTTIQGIGFPIPLIQGTNNGMPSLTYCENSLMDNNGVGSRMTGNIARFLGRNIVSSERVIPNSIISQIPHTNLRNEH